MQFSRSQLDSLHNCHDNNRITSIELLASDKWNTRRSYQAAMIHIQKRDGELNLGGRQKIAQESTLHRNVFKV